MGAADIKKPVDGLEFKTEQARPTSTDSSASTVEDDNSEASPRPRPRPCDEKEEIEMDLCKSTHDEVDGSDVKKEEKEEKKVDVVNEEDEKENDGFRTPTGPEHRIPATTVCPGAPRLSRRSVVIRKRKACTSQCRLRLDFEDDYLNLVFPRPAACADSGGVMFKKERTS